MNTISLRKTQVSTLNEVLTIVETDTNPSTNIIAHLCPRFGKTIWSLSVFNALTETRAMVVPAYVLSALSSMTSELKRYQEFSDVIEVTTESEYRSAISNGFRVFIPLSLCGELESWKTANRWISKIPNLFLFADESDFGSHTENQVAKIKFITSSDTISIFASGTNIQRLAKCAPKVSGIVSCTYSQLETEEENFIQRRFYAAKLDQLAFDLKDFDEKIIPSWNKIWSKPSDNNIFISKFFHALTSESKYTGLNLSKMTGESIDCGMLFLSADKKEMKQVIEIARNAVPNWGFYLLNGDHTTNRGAEKEVQDFIRASSDKDGVLIVSNNMGSRSFSIPQIQASIIAFDRGSNDAAMQKMSRCLTPGRDGKRFGHIIDLAFDPNRSENIESLILEEAVAVQRAIGGNFNAGVNYVMNAIDVFNVDSYGNTNVVTESDLFTIYSDNENLLRVADVAIDLDAIDKRTIEILEGIIGVSSKKGMNKARVAGKAKGVKGVTGAKSVPSISSVKSIEKMVNEAIHAVNQSSASIYAFANHHGSTYRECLETIILSNELHEEFITLIGVEPSAILELLEKNLLNEVILDMVVRNSIENPSHPSNGMRLLNRPSLGIMGRPDSKELWEEIISHIPDSILLKDGVRILNVAAGHGTEAGVLQDRMIALGVPQDKINESIICLDRFNLFTNELKAKYGFKNIITADFMSWNTDMKFDVIVGNPPYQNTEHDAKRWTLWSAFVEKAKSMSDCVAMITPSSIVSPSCFHLIKNDLVTLNLDVNEYFNGIGISFSYFVTITNNKQLAKIIANHKEFHVSTMGLHFLPSDVTDKSIEQIDWLKTRTSRKWKRGELHTSNAKIFNDDGLYDVFHTNSQSLRTNVKHENLSKIRVAVTLSGYPIFKIIHNAYCSQATVWTDFDSFESAKVFMNECNGKEIQDILKTFKWSGWNSKEIISCL